MCTAASYLSRDFYFGRNFDYEISYNETIRITPRNYPLSFKTQDTMESTHIHYTMMRQMKRAFQSQDSTLQEMPIIMKWMMKRQTLLLLK